jgi:hypothetical protein
MYHRSLDPSTVCLGFISPETRRWTCSSLATETDGDDVVGRLDHLTPVAFIQVPAYASDTGTGGDDASNAQAGDDDGNAVTKFVTGQEWYVYAGAGAGVVIVAGIVGALFVKSRRARSRPGRGIAARPGTEMGAFDKI